MVRSLDRPLRLGINFQVVGIHYWQNQTGVTFILEAIVPTQMQQLKSTTKF